MRFLDEIGFLAPIFFCKKREAASPKHCQKSILVTILTSTVRFLFSLTICVCVCLLFYGPLRECLRARALPGFLVTAPPSVCVPDVIGALACGFQTPQKKGKKKHCLEDTRLIWCLSYPSVGAPLIPGRYVSW